MSSAMSTAAPKPVSRASSSFEGGNQDKFLTFCLGVEEYAFPILVVREIIGLIDVTPLPKTPAYVKGVINLRGRIIPVIELRSRFGLPLAEYTSETCILVVEVAGQGGESDFQLGVIVDRVREVLVIEPGNIAPPSSLGCGIPLDSVQGIGKVKEKVVILLDPATALGEALAAGREAKEAASGSPKLAA